MSRRAPNAYTIGHKASYDAWMEDGKERFKLGRRAAEGDEPEYKGGFVWRTEHEARIWLSQTSENPESNFGRTGDGRMDFGQGPKECDVYGLVLRGPWAKVTEPGPGGVNYLLEDALIVPALAEPAEFRVILDKVPVGAIFTYTVIPGHEWLTASPDPESPDLWVPLEHKREMAIPRVHGTPQEMREFVRRKLFALERKGGLLIPYSVLSQTEVAWGMGFAPGRAYIGLGHEEAEPLEATAEGVAELAFGAILADEVMTS